MTILKNSEEMEIDNQDDQKPSCDGPKCTLCGNLVDVSLTKAEEADSCSPMSVCRACSDEYMCVGRSSSHNVEDARVDLAPSLVLSTTAAVGLPSRDAALSANDAETVFPDGLYTGTLGTDGVPHGFGRMRFRDGSVYEGQWSNGKMNGEGECKYPGRKGSYSGEWKDGYPHGQGLFIFSKESCYNGSWKKGMMDGRGVYTFAASEEYDGEWKQNQPDGEGIFKYASGNVYEGQWRNGKRQGNGIFTYTNGHQYQGEWHDDKKDGIGIYRWSNGDFDIKSYYEDVSTDGIRYNSSMTKAWSLSHGNILKEISLQEAAVYRDNVCMVSPYVAYFLYI